MPKASCRPPSGWRRPARYYPSGRSPCSCATSEPCSTSPARRARPFFFLCLWTWQALLDLDGRRTELKYICDAVASGVAANTTFGSWEEAFAGDAVHTAAMLESFLHRASVVQIAGESYRL